MKGKDNSMSETVRTAISKVTNCRQKAPREVYYMELVWLRQGAENDRLRLHEQPIEAPETVVPYPSDYAESLGLRSQESPSTSSSGAQTSIDCAISPHERRSKRSVDINNRIVLHCKRHDAFLAKHLSWG